MKHEMVPYFDEDTKANDWVKNIMRRVRWDFFRHQGAWVYMAGERGKRRNPMTRYNVYDYIRQTINEEMRELTHYLTMELLRECHDDKIDFDRETARYYNNYFELSEGDEGYNGTRTLPVVISTCLLDYNQSIIIQEERIL